MNNVEGITEFLVVLSIFLCPKRIIIEISIAVMKRGVAYACSDDAYEQAYQRYKVNLNY